MLYHKDVYLPKDVARVPSYDVRLKLGEHARRAAASDGLGDLTSYLPEALDFKQAELIEVEVVNGHIAKRVVRLPATEEMDLILVVHPDGRVRTVWGNNKQDNHNTLRREKYVQPPR